MYKEFVTSAKTSAKISDRNIYTKVYIFWQNDPVNRYRDKRLWLRLL